ncbi:MAG TPA: class I SAM-dependent methyltransferase [Gaiellaceae bacterium]|nr:class I SAM-dependent methyltransferase [Gaiellaceae bacterium]
MTETSSKYAGAAERWSEEQYADSVAYLRHRAELIVSLGPRLQPGDRVLDLACGDAGLADFLRPYDYLGVDASEEMVRAAQARGARVELADLNEYEPPAPVAATTCFRAIYYAGDRRAFFRRVAGYTKKKVVFDLNPRQYRVEDIRADLAAAGFDRVALHPFFVPQTRALPAPLAALLRAAEWSGPFARAALRVRFTYLVAASR